MGSLWCLDAESGDVLWEREIVAEFEVATEPFGFNTSPVPCEDMVVINVGRSIAFDAQTGETIWETEDYGYSYGTPVRFEREGMPALAVFNGKGLVVLDALGGEEILLHDWTTKFNVNCATPILIGDDVFISTGYDNKGCALLDVSGADVEVLWENKNMRNNMAGCVLIDEHLYGFDDKQLACIRVSGESCWSVRGTGNGALSAAGDRLIVLDEDGRLTIGLADPAGYEPAVEVEVFTEGVCWTPPVLCQGRIYLRNNRGHAGLPRSPSDRRERNTLKTPKSSATENLHPNDLRSRTPLQTMTADWEKRDASARSTGTGSERAGALDRRSMWRHSESGPGRRELSSSARSGSRRDPLGDSCGLVGPARGGLGWLRPGRTV